MKMPFGKYKGSEVKNLPKQYIQWLDRRCNLHGDLAKEVKKLANYYDDLDVVGDMSDSDCMPGGQGYDFGQSDFH